jgi:hypothetical protein
MQSITAMVRRCRLKPADTRVESALISLTGEAPYGPLITLINWGGPLCTNQRLKLKIDRQLSNLAFTFKLRRYAKAHLRAVVLYIVDASEQCGFSIKAGWCRLTPSNPR